MPLTRGADGGSASASSAARGGNVTIQIATPDLNSFRRSESLSHRPDRPRGRARPAEHVMTAAFHEVLFPLDIALQERGRVRSARPTSSRSDPAARSVMRAGRIRAGVTMRATASRPVGAVRCRSRSSRSGAGRLYGFRWRDRLDQYFGRSPAGAVTPLDQVIGTGDGFGRNVPARQDLRTFYAPYRAPIVKPVPAASASRSPESRSPRARPSPATRTTGIVTFLSGHMPAAGAAVTAGFQFDVPVRFDTDYLEVDLSAFAAGAIPKIPLVEIKP